MAVWTSDDILRFLANAESDFCEEFPVLIDRWCLDIKNGIPEYTLPDYVVNIKRFTYKGAKLDPMPHRYFREAFQGAASQISTPYWYVHTNLGTNIIKLFPTPAEDLTTTDIGLWDTNIENKCIVEFFRTPDEETGHTIPPYIRRRLLKCGVLKDCFSMENQGQNLKNSQYFDLKWKAMIKQYGNILQTLLAKPRRLAISDPSAYQNYPAAPVLPIDRYGIGVRTGE
jgi:hypothetical protein